MLLTSIGDAGVEHGPQEGYPEQQEAKPLDGRMNLGLHHPQPTESEESLEIPKASRKPPVPPASSMAMEQSCCSQHHSKEPFLSRQLLPHSLLGRDV